MLRFYIDSIRNPVDGYTYELKICRRLSGAEVFVEQIGGSKEEIKYVYALGILRVTTPIFVVNPMCIYIGWESKNINKNLQWENS